HRTLPGKERRQIGIEAETDWDEPDNVLEYRPPIAPRHAELDPKRLQNDFIQNLISFRDIKIHTRPSLIPNDSSRALVEKIESHVVHIFNRFGPAGLLPSCVVAIDLCRCELLSVDCETPQLAPPAIILTRRIAEDGTTVEVPGESRGVGISRC